MSEYKKGSIYEWLDNDIITLTYTFDCFDFEFEVSAKRVYKDVYEAVIREYFDGVEISEELKEYFYRYLWNENMHLSAGLKEYILECFESEAYDEFLRRYW